MSMLCREVKRIGLVIVGEHPPLYTRGDYNSLRLKDDPDPDRRGAAVDAGVGAEEGEVVRRSYVVFVIVIGGLIFRIIRLRK